MASSHFSSFNLINRNTVLEGVVPILPFILQKRKQETEWGQAPESRSYNVSWFQIKFFCSLDFLLFSIHRSVCVLQLNTFHKQELSGGSPLKKNKFLWWKYINCIEGYQKPKYILILENDQNNCELFRNFSYHLLNWNWTLVIVNFLPSSSPHFNFPWLLGQVQRHIKYENERWL